MPLGELMPKFLMVTGKRENQEISCFNSLMRIMGTWDLVALNSRHTHPLHSHTLLLPSCGHSFCGFFLAPTYTALAQASQRPAAPFPACLQTLNLSLGRGNPKSVGAHFLLRKTPPPFFFSF